jgi:hypothetical protein
MSIIYINPYQFAAAYDPDAQSYITAVEAADGQALEVGVKDAINAFVVGCKADGIWSAIKASCIMAGARTLAGALVPIVGTAPTNFNFVAGDYDRETGLVGDGSTKYLDSNRNNNVDPQDSNHNAVWLSSYTSADQYLMGSGSSNGHNFLLARTHSAFFRNRFSFIGTESRAATGSQFSGGLFAASRSSASSVSVTYKQASGQIHSAVTTTSASPSNTPMLLFSNTNALSNCRIAFYSIGESLDLALLDARVTALVSAIGAAIP